MLAIVSIDTAAGLINRYELGGDRPRRSHGASFTAKHNLSEEKVERFRCNPGEQFRLAPVELKDAV